MKKMRWVSAGVLTACAVLAAESEKKDMPGGDAGAPPEFTGKVMETMDAARYTYVHVDIGSTQIWAAAPAFTVQVGETVTVPRGLPMTGFYSSSLKRTFDTIYFVNGVHKEGEEGVAPPPGHPPVTELPMGHAHSGAPSVDLDMSDVTRPEGGLTVGEVYAQKSSLAGQTVLVRGKVAKFTPAIMNRNWLHLRDGTGRAGSDDLTVGTKATAAVGDLVTVKGRLATDKDYGLGIRYDLLLEDADVAVEKAADAAPPAAPAP